MKELQAIVSALVQKHPENAVLATLATVEGSSYRRPGARLLVLPDGSRIGSISGGCLEEDVLQRAHVVAQSGRAEVVVYDTTSENDLVWGVGLGCHGVVRVVIERLPPHPDWAFTLAEAFAARRGTRLVVRHRASNDAPLGTRSAHSDDPSPDVFVQTIAPPPALFVFGAGDDAIPLTRFAKELGWLITVADPRPALATAERFPQADAILVGPADELPKRVALDSESLAVVMTHHYVHDLPLLRHLIKQPVAYLGLLGPRKRAEKLLVDLVADGLSLSNTDRARLRAPVGLDLGSDGPEQVALAIVAEIQSVLGRRDARPLRERNRPIHDQ